MKATQQQPSRKDYTNGSYYIGELNFTVEHGEGSVFFPDGTVLTGHFTQGVCLKARIVYSNGSIYEG